MSGVSFQPTQKSDTYSKPLSNKDHLNHNTEVNNNPPLMNHNYNQINQIETTFSADKTNCITVEKSPRTANNAAESHFPYNEHLHSVEQKNFDENVITKQLDNGRTLRYTEPGKFHINVLCNVL